MKEHDLERINAPLRRAGVVCAGRLEWFGEIASTNSWLMGQRDLHGRVCLAELQTAGRGRRGRSWRAPRSSSVLLSMGWRLGGAGAAGLSLVSGLAIVDALGRLGIDGVGLKWPNDVMARGRKLGGVLTELSGDHGVVGMGINVAVPPGVDGVARADLRSLGHDVDRDLLAATLIIAHCRYLARFCNGGFAQFVEQWNGLNVHRNLEVSVESPSASFAGVARGVARDGALIIERDGVRGRVISGKVSVRPVKPVKKDDKVRHNSAP